MTLWDHISRRQREYMASMLEDPDGSGPKWHSLLIRVLDGYAEVLHSGRRLPCLGEIKDDIAAVSPDPWKELRILISPKKEILSLYIADPQGYGSCRIPKELWGRLVDELGFEHLQRDRC